MRIYTRHVIPHGFRGTGMFIDAKWHLHYSKTDPKRRAVTVIASEPIQSVSIFWLSKADFKVFVNGKLSLVPSGCCNPSGRRSVTDPEIVFAGEIKNLKQLDTIIERSEMPKPNTLGKEFWARYGRAIMSVRARHKVDVSDVEGMSASRLSVIESGSPVRADEVVALARAHKLTSNAYLDQIAKELAVVEASEAGTAVKLGDALSLEVHFDEETMEIYFAFPMRVNTWTMELKEALEVKQQLEAAIVAMKREIKRQG